jgi:DNA-binding GntR family transcriptional regulator
MATRAEPQDPAYRALARDLRTSILKGEYSDGLRLPTEAELAEQYGVSRQTVRRAFHDLVAEGLVYRVPGRGTFAANREDGHYLRQFGSIEDLMNLSVDTTMQILTPLHRRIDVDVAGRLRLTTDVVWRVDFVRLHHDVTFCVTSINLVPEVAALLVDLPDLQIAGTSGTATIIGLLEGRMQDPVAEADQSITAVPAPDVVAAELDCAPGTPLLRVDRLYLTTTGRPVELAISYFLPAHYSYRLRLRRSVL